MGSGIRESQLTNKVHATRLIYLQTNVVLIRSICSDIVSHSKWINSFYDLQEKTENSTVRDLHNKLGCGGHLHSCAGLSLFIGIIYESQMAVWKHRSVNFH